eukprot:163145_1
MDHLTESLEIRRDVHGCDHFLISSTLNSIGLILYQIGKFKFALDAFLEAIRIRTECKSSSHGDVANVLFNAARVYQITGEHEESIALYEQVIHINHINLEFGSSSSSINSDTLSEERASMYCHRDIAIALQQIGEIHQD